MGRAIPGDEEKGCSRFFEFMLPSPRNGIPFKIELQYNVSHIFKFIIIIIFQKMMFKFDKLN